MFRTILLLLLLVIKGFSARYENNKFSITFEYPSDWSILEQTDSSIYFYVGANRLAMFHILPGVMPGAWLEATIQVYKDSYLNSDVWGRGAIELNGHHGYWIGITQAKKSTFETFHSHESSFFLPSIQKVLYVKYTNEFLNADFWDTDVRKLELVRSTFSVAGYKAPNRLSLSENIKSPRNWMETKYPAHFTPQISSSETPPTDYDMITLFDFEDNTEMIISHKILRLNNPITNWRAISDSLVMKIFNRDTSIYNNQYESDTLNVVQDTQDSINRIYAYVFCNSKFPKYKYIQVSKTGNDNFIYIQELKAYLVEWERKDYLTTLINADVIISLPVQSRISPNNYKEFKPENEELHFQQRSMLYNLLGQKLNTIHTPYNFAHPFSKSSSLPCGVYLFKNGSKNLIYPHIHIAR